MVSVRKYKYYLTKPKSEIVKDVFFLLLKTGGIILAANSPYFLQNVLKEYSKWQKYPKRKISDTFYRLRQNGFIDVKTVNNQIYISLTPEGKKKAGIYQIDRLKISRPKRWDGKWRIVLFDIPEKKKISREALRGKLKELRFFMFQESAWIYPFECRIEIELLQEFFGLSGSEMRLILAENIGDDSMLKEKFEL